MIRTPCSKGHGTYHAVEGLESDPSNKSNANYLRASTLNWVLILILISQFCQIGKDCDQNGDKLSKNNKKSPYCNKLKSISR